MVTNNQTIVTVKPGKQEVFVIREFEASRDLVFKAFTDPELFPLWSGPRGLTLSIDKFDKRTGGYYRYTQKDPGGNEYGFNGVVHEVLAPERIIQTLEFEGFPEKGHVVLETMRFEALANNRTRLTMQSVFQSVADRDGMVQSGMERGQVDSHERLDELFAGKILG